MDESATIILARLVETAAFSETRTDSVLAAALDRVAASPACANDMSVLIAEDTEAAVWDRADDSAAAVLVEASAAAVAMAALLLAVASFAAFCGIELRGRGLRYNLRGQRSNRGAIAAGEARLDSSRQRCRGSRHLAVDQAVALADVVDVAVEAKHRVSPRANLEEHIIPIGDNEIERAVCGSYSRDDAAAAIQAWCAKGIRQALADVSVGGGVVDHTLGSGGTGLGKTGVGQSAGQRSAAPLARLETHAIGIAGRYGRREAGDEAVVVGLHEGPLTRPSIWMSMTQSQVGSVPQRDQCS